TTVALLSGRNRAALAAVSGAVAPVELVGSHGSEWESGFDRPPGDDDEVVLSRIRGALEEIVTRTPGAHVELKPTSAVLHVRPVEDPSLRERALADALAGPARLAGAHVTEGKNVVEIAVREASKGAAVETLVARAGAQVAVVGGDGVAGGRGLARLGPEDGGGKVGAGGTPAGHRVDGHPGAGGVPGELARLRG